MSIAAPSRRNPVLEPVALPTDPDARVRELLSEPLKAAQDRERSAFRTVAGERSSRIVLFGAGGLGRRTLAGLRKAGVEPLAFADNRQSLWGEAIDDVAVLAPEEAVARFGGTAVFVVSIWRAGGTHRYAQTAAQLREAGAAVVVPIAWLAWRYAEVLLPFYALDRPSRVLEDAVAVRRGYGLMDDLRSRQEFATQLEWRLFGDPSVLDHPLSAPQYLVEDVAPAAEGDVVVDCGAYDGDTLRAWLRERGASFARYLALEPDPITRERLEGYVASLPPEVSSRVLVLPYAVGDVPGEQIFAASGQLSSARSAGDGVRVEVVRVDDLWRGLGAERPSVLKADIEGAELECIAGAAELIATARPLVTIAAYHCQDHLWRVPLALAALCPDYRFALRPHNEEGWDLVCYAVPPERIGRP